MSTGNARCRVEDSADEDETVPITHIRHAARTHGAGVWRHYAAARQQVIIHRRKCEPHRLPQRNHRRNGVLLTSVVTAVSFLLFFLFVSFVFCVFF